MPVRRSKRAPRMNGKGIMSTLLNGLKAAHKLVKEKQLISKCLHAFGHKKYAGNAKQLGYGKRR